MGVVADDVGNPAGHENDDPHRDHDADMNSKPGVVGHSGDLIGDLGGADSPWAHDVPISPPPPLPEAWTRVEPVTLSAPSIAGHLAEPAGQLADPTHPSQPHAATESDGHRSRRSLLAVGVVGILVVAVIGARAVVGGGDDEGTDGDSAAEVATDDSAPTTADTATTVVRTRIPSGSQASGSASSVPATTAADELPEAPRQWVTTPIALDPRLQSMTVPTQIVVLNTDGVVHVIDIADGCVRSVDTEARSLPTSRSPWVIDGVVITSYSNERRHAAEHRTATCTQVDIPGGTESDPRSRRAPTTSSWRPTTGRATSNRRTSCSPPMARRAKSPVDRRGLRDLGTASTCRATGEAIVSDSGGVYAIDAAGTRPPPEPGHPRRRRRQPRPGSRVRRSADVSSTCGSTECRVNGAVCHRPRPRRSTGATTRASACRPTAR